MTGNPETESEYVYETELNHMIGFLDELGLEEVNLVGQSRGAGLAGRVAVEIPDRVRTLTVINSGTLAPSWGKYQHRRSFMHRGEPTDTDSQTYFEDYVRHIHESIDYQDDHITGEFCRAAAYMRERPEARETHHVMESGARDRWHATMTDHMELTRRRIRRGHLDMPVLIYWGRDDPTSILEQGQALYELISQTNPMVRMHVVDRAGHGVYREYPLEFNRNVITFIDIWEDKDRMEMDTSSTPEYYESQERQ
jgi:2-hydroxy-6-oxo-6-(2'-carboxyphenyl)-hexa-2,4-dienoate hydrolase